MKAEKKLIAKFMELDFVTVGYIGTESETKWQKENQEWFDSHYEFHDHSVGDYAVNVEDNIIFWQDDLNYDSSWNDLMPVVEKINGLNYNVHIYPTRARFYKNNTDFIESIHPGYSLIDVVYSGVVEFIKWYNSKKQ